MSVISPQRHVAVIVAPLITFVAIVIMLVVAHFYERLPAKLPECGFRKSTGIPCAACGGTRAMQSIARGKLTEALKFHPLFSSLVLASPFWLAFGLKQFVQRESMPVTAIQNRRLKIGLLLFFTFLILNWFYLIFFLP
ncbi:MAG: DUF2752 domain-containing protein [Verrucomicrobiales bacterium]|nr:DUF2752 domain-containing protein [Verrucomicrobiales bacterium]